MKGGRQGLGIMPPVQQDHEETRKKRVDDSKRSLFRWSRPAKSKATLWWLARGAKKSDGVEA